MTKLIRLVFLVMAAGVILCILLATATPVLGPFYDYYFDPEYGYVQGKAALDKALASCHPDELMVQMYFDKHGYEGATLNFTTKTLSGGYADPTITWSWGGRMISVYSNMDLGERPAFTDEQIVQIKNLLTDLRAPSETGGSSTVSYRDQCHLAFYQGGQLRVYHYSKEEARDQIEKLCGLLGIPGVP